MRTTLQLADPLFAQAKGYAAAHQCSFTAVVEDALHLFLTQKTTQPAPVKLHTVGGNGVQAGVDLDDTASLLNKMDDLAWCECAGVRT